MVAKTTIFFFHFLNDWVFLVHIYTSFFFILSSFDRHLGCLHILTIWNNCYKLWKACIFSKLCFCFPCIHTQEVELLIIYASSICNFLKKLHVFSIANVPILRSEHSSGFPCSTTLPKFLFVFFDERHS